MAIKGLTDRSATLPIVGMIRKGEKKTQANKPGADLTYFRLDTQDAGVQSMWNVLYPGEPREIEVVLPYKEIEDNFDAWMEKWVSGGLVHRCDGENVVVRRKKDGDYETFGPGQGPACPGGCKQVGRLSVLLPQVRRMVTLTVLTTSKHDIKNLMSNLRSYYGIRQNLRGIPFVLRRVRRKVSTPAAGGKRIRREKWFLQLEPGASWVGAQLGVMEADAFPQRVLGAVAGLIAAPPVPDDNGDDEADWDEGVFDATDPDEDTEEQPAPQAEPAPEPAAQKKVVPKAVPPEPTNGNVWPARPFDAGTMRQYVEYKLSTPLPAVSDVDGQRKACMSTLSTLTNADAESQRLIISWLFDKTSRGDLTIGEKSIILDWGGCKPPDYQPSGFAITEVENVIKAARLAAGQLEMELDNVEQIDD